MNVAVLFPGQGTQVPLMGRPWRSQPCWEIVERAEWALAEPLSHLLLDPDAEVLARTRDAQLAVLLSSLLAWEAIRDRIDTPVAFAGHSLGQITALVASGSLTLEEGVRLALRRADFTQEAADRRPGVMVALMGASLEQAEQACSGDDPAQVDRGGAWVANDNAPGQVVIGGSAESVEKACERARALGVRRVIPLKVAAAFHTPLMSEAAESLAVELESASFSCPRVPVVCNVDARAYDDTAWAPRLALHLVSPVRWRSSMNTLRDLGAERYFEMGPGGVLAGLARRSLGEVETMGVAGPDDLPAAVSAVGAP